MKSIGKYLIIGLLLTRHSLVFAQFNTLTRNEVKSNELITDKQNLREEFPEKKEKEKKSIIQKLFNSPTKMDMQKQIDSLKKLMLHFSLSRIEENKFSSQIGHDSLFPMNNGQITNQIVSTEKHIKKFNFLNEEELVSKISMPLGSRLFVTSPYGWRVHPILGASKMHNGTDFKANYENVYAVLDGIVTESGWNSGGGGNYIKIRHSNTFVTSYLHLSEIYYKAGEFVKAGFIIAKSGNTGNSTGAHLHFAVTEKGKYINPIRFLNDLIAANNLIATYYETGRDQYNP